MPRRIIQWLTIIIIASPVFSYTQDRLALLIGNGNYTHQGRLQNPVNDATDLAVTLRSLGFEVMSYTNQSQRQMKAVIDQFGDRLRGKRVGLFYFAGHGAQAQGENFLFPIDANPKSENEIEYDCVNAGRVLSKMQTAGCWFNIVILDACRNNPFAESWTRGGGSRGLAFISAPSGSIVAYATSPSKVADDGPGRNGLYTSALLRHISQPGLKIEDVFKRVRSDVQQASGNRQVPWELSSLTGDFYFKTGTGETYKPEVKPSNSLEGMVADINGNEYKTIRIGNQWWMAENLRVTRYRNGAPIPKVADGAKWPSITEGAYCEYDNDTRDIDTYGRLYNYHAVKDSRGLAPEGWHIPSETEWQSLINYLGGVNAAGGKLKEAGTIHWKDLNEGATNKSGFTALPGGFRNLSGRYLNKYSEACFWSLPNKNDFNSFVITYEDPFISPVRYDERYGFSVRCVKD